MGIKETPTNYRTYFKTMKNAVRPKYNKTVAEYNELYAEEKALYDELKSKVEVYDKNYGIKLNNYSEFTNNEYIDGKFYDDAKGLFISKKHNYTATNPLYNLYKLARQQKDLNKLHQEKRKYEQMLDLTLKQYAQVLETFYNEVHKKMIIEGKGYVFESTIGWLCINRCKLKVGKSKFLDYQATKRNKAKLLAEGKRLYNKEEAEYAARTGQPYDGVDYRVYRNDEYCYEIPIINSKLGVGRYKFECANRRGYTEGKTNADMINECNSDLNKICELPIDIKRKLYLCLEVDDLLYLNFIRNEAQESAHTTKADRKNRQ